MDNNEYQITSLRKDFKTFGRYAVVGFVNSIGIDAKRRDFTINALYLDYEGNLVDPYDGYKDIINKNLKFIGNPIERIKEDYLRLFRYCRFYGKYSRFDDLHKSRNQLLKLVNNIKILSNKRIIDEFLKILLEDNVEFCLTKMKELGLDKYIFINAQNNQNIKKHPGFKIKSFSKIKQIKLYAKEVLQHEKLDLNCVLIPHLYDLKLKDIIVDRFQFSKQKIKYLNFIKIIKNFNFFIDLNFFKQMTLKEKEIKILQFVWECRVKGDFNNKTIFKNDRIPFNWYKLALLHILPVKIIDQLDFNKLVWPTFPLSRQEIRIIEPGLNHQEENNLLYKSEEFWVKNDFKNSNKDLLNFVTKLSKRNKCR